MNGDISWQDLAGPLMFHPIPPIGSMILSGNRSINNCTVWANSQHLKVSIPTSWSSIRSSRKYSMLKMPMKNLYQENGMTSSILSKK
jgi:hypothetical protein